MSVCVCVLNNYKLKFLEIGAIGVKREKENGKIFTKKRIKMVAKQQSDRQKLNLMGIHQSLLYLLMSDKPFWKLGVIKRRKYI